MKRAQAVLVLPPAAFGMVTSASLRRWLARGQLGHRQPESEMLASVVELLGARMPEEGLAALRFWGQSGQRSRSWMAAADPVHLETRMRDVRVRHIAPGDLDLRDLDELIMTLQSKLGGDEFDFIRIGSHAYVRASEPFVVPGVSASVVDSDVPDAHTPSGPDGASFHRLLGETEMVFHDHEINTRRAASGKPMINSFWYWGGGVAPERLEHDLPPLFTGDPLFKGYWRSAGARVDDWEGDLAACMQAKAERFVAVLPEMPRLAGADMVQHTLATAQDFLHRGYLDRATILFRDGLSATLRRRDRFRFWRRSNSLLEAAND